METYEMQIYTWPRHIVTSVSPTPDDCSILGVMLNLTANSVRHKRFTAQWKFTLNWLQSGPEA